MPAVFKPPQVQEVQRVVVQLAGVAGQLRLIDMHAFRLRLLAERGLIMAQVQLEFVEAVTGMIAVAQEYVRCDFSENDAYMEGMGVVYQYVFAEPLPQFGSWLMEVQDFSDVARLAEVAGEITSTEYGPLAIQVIMEMVQHIAVVQQQRQDVLEAVQELHNSTVPFEQGQSSFGSLAKRWIELHDMADEMMDGMGHMMVLVYRVGSAAIQQTALRSSERVRIATIGGWRQFGRVFGDTNTTEAMVTDDMADFRIAVYYDCQHQP